MNHKEDYAGFLERKRHSGSDGGFEPEWLPDFLFDFQRALVEWALRKGRAAIFADCGMGKTPMQLVWAENVVRHTNGRVLIVTPLAVSVQTLHEAEKFHIEARRSRDGTVDSRITVTNYDRLHHFNAADFVGCVCDESSAIKAFDGARRALVTDFVRKMPYRLLCTATAAPNDYIELGTSSEALGQLGYMDMLGRFFKNDQNTSDTRRKWAQQGGAARAKWRFKGHAQEPFWRWVCSWARALRKPSDLGCDDSRFVLPQLIEREHRVEARKPRPGMLFDLPPQGLWEEREEQRRTIIERCEAASALVSDTEQPAVVWCHLNDEGDMLKRMIPESRQVRGSDDPDEKEETLTAFGRGELRVLITKPKIGAWGLNWQHCAHMTFFPSHSYEQYYQAVRRSWRYGQSRDVVVDIVTTETGHAVMENLQRKARQAETMFERLVAHMNDSLRIEGGARYESKVSVPSWLEPLEGPSDERIGAAR